MISFTNGDWEIAKVVNLDNDKSIFGDTYSINGELIQENHILQLDSLGKLKASWPGKGFSIIRKTPTSIELYLRENFTDKDFVFNIVLESGNELRRIKVSQKPSQGYKIKSIKYTVVENDSDSIYVGRGETYSFDINASIPPKVTFHPFLNIFEFSHFESLEDAAFPWTKADSAMVEVPTKILNGKVLTSGENAPYSNELVEKPSKFEEEIAEVTVPKGQSKFVVKIEYRKRRVTYTLHLISNRTKKDKIIKGKWIETAPTGNYTIDWK